MRKIRSSPGQSLAIHAGISATALTKAFSFLTLRPSETCRRQPMTISAFPRPRSALSPDAWKRQGRDNRRCRGANLQRSACGPDFRALKTHPNVEGVEECSNGSSSESRSHPKAWSRLSRQLACSSRTMMLTAVADVALAVDAGWAATQVLEDIESEARTALSAALGGGTWRRGGAPRWRARGRVAQGGTP